jgi:hypothetical protein
VGHASNSFARAEKRAGDLGRKGCLYGVRRDRIDTRFAAYDAGVVYKGSDTTQLAIDAPEHLDDVGLDGDVSANGDGTPAISRNALDKPFSRIGICSIVDADGHSACGGGFGDRGSNAAPCACYHSHPGHLSPPPELLFCTQRHIPTAITSMSVPGIVPRHCPRH